MRKALAILAVVGCGALVAPAPAEAISQVQAQNLMAKWIKSKPGPCGDGTSIKCDRVTIMVCERYRGWTCSGSYQESVYYVGRRNCDGQGRIEQGRVVAWMDTCHGI